MPIRFLRIVFLAVLLLGTAFSAVALAQGGEMAPTQSPVQVIVQIFVTAIILKVLNHFDLP